MKSREKPLGLRCQAQQIVLADMSRQYGSWIEVEARIKEVERELRTPSRGNSNDK